MKRILTLTLVLAVIFGSVCTAKAVDVKVKGTWEWGIGWLTDKNFYDEMADDPFAARQRIRTRIDFIASESLSGTLMFEIGGIFWGRGGTSGRSSGGALDADGVNVETKHAYLDWVVPGSDLAIRMGIQFFTLPSATGFMNPVYSADGAGIIASYRFNDAAAVTLFWLRPFDMYSADPDSRRLDDEMDLIGLVVPLTVDGLKVTPWFSYARIGGTSGYWAYRRGGQSDGGFTQNLSGASVNSFDSGANAWWAGLAVELNMFDPLSFRFDVNYGYLSGSADWGQRVANDWLFSSRDNPGSRGWLIDAILEYKLDWGVPGILGWWASGDSESDINAGKFGRMPIVGADVGFGPTGFATRSSGVPGWGYDMLLTASGVGTWGVAAQITDLAFVEKLSHTIRFAYIRGTNDSDIIKNQPNVHRPNYGGGAPNLFSDHFYLTDKDCAYEINFATKYQMYENLTVHLDTSWVKLDLDGGVWKKDGNGDYGDDTTDAWKAEFIFRYVF